MNRCTFFSGLLFCILQGAFAYEEELRFVRGLTEEGFPKLAEKVLFRTLENSPEAASEAPELRIRILIASRNFDQAAAQISKIRNPEPLWLFLAESSTGHLAARAYQHYFTTAKQPNDQAVFNYGALLEERGDDTAAIKLYEKVDSRPVKSRLAALLAESEPDRALKLAEEVQLGGLDFWFGSAVVSWAQVMIGKEEWDETQTILESQLELLKTISDSVPPSASPLAGARYFLGLCYEHAGQKAAALTQFYNVYAKYGDSEWGPLAQSKAQALINDFEAEGKTVKIDLGANLAKMEESTFRVARRLFFDRQYAKAVPATIGALNDYPEGDEAVTALRELALCAIQLDDSLMAKTVGVYLSERFAAEPKAGDALLAAGKAALDSKDEELAWTLYDLFIEKFPAHPRTPAVLYSLSGLRKNEDYLFQLLENYPDSSYLPRALGRLAWNAYQVKDYKTATERFAPYVETETDPQKRTRARFAFGDSYRQLKLWATGSACFRTLEKDMIDASLGFGVSAETLSFNRPFWEKSIYYQAVCHKELGVIDEAIDRFDRFLDQFPQSELAEQVRFSKAKTLVEAERYAEALPALEGLGKQYAEPVCYYRGVAQYETGAYEASFQTLEKLLTGWPVSAFKYEAMFVRGRAFSAAGRADDAIRVFGDIMNFATNDELMHRASLELGRAQSDPAEKLASFQRVALLADPKKDADLIAQALFESLPLYLELDRPADLIADADRLTAEFPMFGKTDEIQNLKTKTEQQQELTTEAQSKG